MIEIEKCFSSPIGIVTNKKDYELTDYCLQMMSTIKSGGQDWLSKPYTTNGTYNILKDSKFKELNTWVENSVEEFTNACGWAKTSPSEGWFNIYKKDDCQEFHIHKHRHFSCIYYLDTQENDSKTIFNRSPMPMIHYSVNQSNVINCEHISFKPVKGILLIFKSDTMHMVEQKKTDDVRITVSYNFKEDIAN
tara:strand:+ start:39 stop:614 length:576 start_codon:yes stop_codon:yes gene_type:complete